MDADAAARVARIRDAVQKERDRLAEITERRVKDQLRRASLNLDDVEGYYLDAKVLAERRSPAHMKAWLDGAEELLRIARENRESVQKR